MNIYTSQFVPCRAAKAGLTLPPDSLSDLYSYYSSLSCAEMQLLLVHTMSLYSLEACVVSENQHNGEKQWNNGNTTDFLVFCFFLHSSGQIYVRVLAPLKKKSRNLRIKSHNSNFFFLRIQFFFFCGANTLPTLKHLFIYWIVPPRSRIISMTNCCMCIYISCICCIQTVLHMQIQPYRTWAHLF